MTFVPLKVMSAYSLLESTIDIENYVRTAKERGYESLALTDCDCLYGAVKFYESCRKWGVKPLLGIRVNYYSQDKSYPLIIFAKNNQGYQDLIQLSTAIQLREIKYNLAEIGQLSKDWLMIIPLSSSEWWACQSDRESQMIMADYQAALAEFYMGFSPSDLVTISHMNEIIHHLESQRVGTIALPEIRMIDREEQSALNVLKIIGSQDNLAEVDYDQIYGEDLYTQVLLTPQDYRDIYQQAGVGQLADATTAFAEKIHWDLSLAAPILPKFPETDGLSSEEYLKNLCQRALIERITNFSSDYQERLDKELDVICSMGFADYFLIVWDICKFAHRQGILMGAGRGSAAGSLVAYILGITHIDPIRYHLIFERFLNSERVTMPDIDLDFPDNKRDEIFTYLAQKYSPKNVAHIATFGTFAARSSLRDVGRVFGLNATELKEWSNTVPAQADITLKEAYEQSSRLQEKVNATPRNQEIFKIAQTIEGLPRHISTHAAGIVLSENELTEIVPLQKGTDELPLTQYTMEDVECVGLLKLDILALKNLTILSDTLKMIPYEVKGQSPITDLSKIPLNNPETMALFQRADTAGIFQFESSGIRRLLQRVKPTDFEDLVAVNALYRPGPMQQIDHFIARKHQQEKISYPHPDLQPILEVTYGIMIYQEQVMQVASKLAGYTLNEADLLRRAMSKKDSDTMEKEREHFIAGTIAEGYPEEIGHQVFELIAEFAGYGFNRSHAVAYSMIAYQMAYLKVHYPASFFAALLRSVRSKEKRNEFLMEARRSQVKLLPPDINKSWGTYTVKGRHIYFGFSQIIGMRRDFVSAIIAERKTHGLFENFVDLIKRIDERFVNEKNLLPLIYAGVFDTLESSRQAIIQSLPTILSNYQMGGSNDDLLALFTLEVVPYKEYSDQEKREQEFEHLGYAFSHAMGTDLNDLYDQMDIQYIVQLSAGKKEKVLATVTHIKQIQTKKGEPMSFVDVSDETGKMSWILFPQKHRQYIRKIEKGQIYMAQGKIQRDRFGLKMLVDSLQPLASILEKSREEHYHLFLRVENLSKDQQLLEKIQKILKKYSGSIPVSLYDQSTEKLHQFTKGYFVKNDPQMIKDLQNLLGENNIILNEND